MLFWIFVIIIIVGIVVAIMYEKSINGFWDWEGWSYIGCGVIAVGVLGTVISTFCFMATYFGLNGTIESNYQRYNILTYQVETGMYENDNEYGKQELVAKVQDWNEDLAFRKANQHDFWIGIYIPNIYDQYEFIDYTNLK